ncbi:MAG: hemolysin III family protein [Candidatus Krumholzibacteria bacterium]|jgi:hemolysin III|nr:hemolysin III family protein [Candidatus Krumholzibacteria bacterium]MDP6669910.1 hemolysin III family protein [Candidatus Krumholzibacteria bacterium]MDP6797938.1 hemolysin III family protein [Candidatus Krumholzibacteria bacterium]MDP7021104.1 hemolysin III family protein [Candidatus Krumholzibacteria bacterium]
MPHREALYSVREEILHSITHGLGALLSIAGLVLLVTFAALRSDVWSVVSVSIFGGSLVLLYLTSTLYHGFPWPRAKMIFRKLDHAAIYLLIAGSYTPFVLVNLRGTWGWTLFGIVWGLALLGILFEVLLKRPPKWLSLGFYLGLGWMVLVAAKPLIESVPALGLLFLALGGLSYSLGTVFYAWKKLPYHHAIWHCFVIGGSVLHFFSVFYSVIPEA